MTEFRLGLSFDDGVGSIFQEVFIDKAGHCGFD